MPKSYGFKWYINVPDTAVFEDSEPRYLVFVHGQGKFRKLRIARGKEKISMTELRQFFSNRSGVKF